MSNGRTRFRARISGTGMTVFLDFRHDARKGWVVGAVRLKPGALVRNAAGTGQELPAVLKKYVRLIDAYLNGKPTALRSIPIDLATMTPFARSVLLAARTIPHGSTISYAELARRAGCPAAVRAAASVMRNNPFPLLVPCHRVITSSGTAGGFMGRTSGRTVALKLQLLRREGCCMSRAGLFRPARRGIIDNADFQRGNDLFCAT